MEKNISVFGIYPDRMAVSDAIDALRQAQYRSTDIAVLLPDNSGSKDFVHEKRTKAPECAAVGAIAGALCGALIAWLISSARITIPGLEALTEVSPLLAAMAGAGALALLGWVTGFLAGLAKPEYVAKRYAGRIRHAGILLSVHCDDSTRRRQAWRTLQETGARKISAAWECTPDPSISSRPAQAQISMGIVTKHTGVGRS